MDSNEWWDIYRFQDCGPDPFVAPVVSDSDSDDNTYKTYERVNTPKWKEVLIKISIVLGLVLIIILSELIRNI